MKKKDKFKELSCDVKNETECEEELDDEGLNIDKEEKEHYEDEE